MPGKVMPLARGTYQGTSSGYRTPDRPDHRGVDFAAPYGTPIYAAADGWVCHAGIGDDPGGFGSWLVIDSQSAHGVDHVYGHMPPSSFLVGYGDRVVAGQHIADVGSEGASSGPHLHFEVWGPPGRFGGTDLDPNMWLTGADEPGQTPAPTTVPAPEPGSVIYGVDISNHQAGINIAQIRREGFDFLIGKVSEGDYYRDATWPAFRDAARAAGMIVAGYHYVSAESDIQRQADLFVDQLGDTTIPAMLDVEIGSGGIDTVHAVRDAIEARGVHVALLYLPQWYWDGHMGRPDLSGLPPLMSSSYGDHRAGYADTIYPGNEDSGWQGYGGQQVAIFQFSERGRVADRDIDVDAFRGTPDQLRALLTGTPIPQEDPPMTAADVQDIKDFIVAYLAPAISDLKDLRNELVGARDNPDYPREQEHYPGHPSLYDVRAGVPAEKAYHGTLLDYVQEIDSKTEALVNVVKDLSTRGAA